MVFLHILHVCILNMSVADVSNHSNELTDLFIKLLQYRSDQNVSFCIFALTNAYILVVNPKQGCERVVE